MCKITDSNKIRIKLIVWSSIVLLIKSCASAVDKFSITDCFLMMWMNGFRLHTLPEGMHFRAICKRTGKVSLMGALRGITESKPKMKMKINLNNRKQTENENKLEPPSQCVAEESPMLWYYVGLHVRLDSGCLIARPFVAWGKSKYSRYWNGGSN